VLVVPYRPPLATAKWVATIQELSAGRLLLGVGAGWMEAEFRALGVPRSRRGAITDATLEFIARCFAADEVEANGQRFLFLPRPARPLIIVGGSPPHALRRAVRFGDGWMPMGAEPDQLAAPIAELGRAAAAAGKPRPEVIAVGALPVGDPGALEARVRALAAVGVTRVVHAWRYADAHAFGRVAEALVAAVTSRSS
jgi:alkanesulfonate monooxygenase SsuD/methylene tetrahydromethanopterin reductase-like flavin-dependent oxidoreductase (luciferase family)